MWFKNLVAYRLPAGAGEADDLDRKLASQALQPCGGFQMESRGWVCPHEDGLFVHRQNRQWLIALGEEQKLLPASVVRQEAEDRAEVIAREQAHPLGRKQMRDLKAQVLNELLPRALVRRRQTRAWIDAAGGWLAVDTSGEAKAEQFMEVFRRSEDSITVRRLETERSPASALASWLVEGDAPGAFTIDQDLELRANDGSKATVRYSRHDLGGREIRDHLSSGKTVVQLGLTWNDRISFVLNDQLQIKRLSFLDILKREGDAEVENDDEQFELDFALMSGELSLLLRDLTAALGGEKARD
ncbi:MAG: recombination-associated protein RdgC [Burkholderiales bacterium]|nr:recombination-associated protein RdgC [Burkholderiales bacterium]